MRWPNSSLRFAFIYLFLLSTKTLSAQLSGKDSGFYYAAVSQAVNLYHQSTGDQSGLYNGPMYTGYPFRFESGTPFFDNNSLDTGSILYDGIGYEQIPLLYENLKDLVIVMDNGYFIQLNSKKIKAFSIPGHRFIRLDENEKSLKGIRPGFYELLYNRQFSVLKKTVKQIMDDLSGDNVVQKLINQSDNYYIRKDSALYDIRGKKDLYALFPEKKKELQQFVKKNKLNFSDDRGSALVSIVAFYEKIRSPL